MTTKIEDAYSMMKSGAQALMAVWAEKMPAERLTELEGIVNAGGRIRMQLDGGAHGEVFNVSAWLMDSNGEQVYLLFSFAPGEDFKNLK